MATYHMNNRISTNFELECVPSNVTQTIMLIEKILIEK